VNDLKIDLQMGRFDLGVADLPPQFVDLNLCKSIFKSFLRFFICKWMICKNKLNIFGANRPLNFFSDIQHDLTFVNRPTNSQPYPIVPNLPCT
jgi:hypothetical protein